MLNSYVYRVLKIWTYVDFSVTNAVPLNTSQIPQILSWCIVVGQRPWMKVQKAISKLKEFVTKNCISTPNTRRHIKRLESSLARINCTQYWNTNTPQKNTHTYQNNEDIPDHNCTICPRLVGGQCLYHDRFPDGILFRSLPAGQAITQDSIFFSPFRCFQSSHGRKSPVWGLLPGRVCRQDCLGRRPTEEIPRKGNFHSLVDHWRFLPMVRSFPASMFCLYWIVWVCYTLLALVCWNSNALGNFGRQPTPFAHTILSLFFPRHVILLFDSVIRIGAPHMRVNLIKLAKVNGNTLGFLV